MILDWTTSEMGNSLLVHIVDTSFLCLNPLGLASSFPRCCPNSSVVRGSNSVQLREGKTKSRPSWETAPWKQTHSKRGSGPGFCLGCTHEWQDFYGGEFSVFPLLSHWGEVQKYQQGSEGDPVRSDGAPWASFVPQAVCSLRTMCHRPLNQFWMDKSELCISLNPNLFTAHY